MTETNKAALAPAEKACKDHPSHRCLPEECCLTAPAEKAGDAIAFVPVHPKQGPLWTETYPADRDVTESRSTRYERMALYATPTPPSADAVKAGKTKCHWCNGKGTRELGVGAAVVCGRCGGAKYDELIQSAAPGGGTKSDGLLEGSLPSGESELLVTAARAPSDPAQEPSVTTFGGSSPCFGRPGDARNTYVDAQEPDAVAYLHRHRKFGRDLQFTQLEACDREQGWTEEPLYRTRPVSLDREAVARIIDPDAFEAWDRAEGSWRKDEAKVRCWPAEEKADAILALIEGRT